MSGRVSYLGGIVKDGLILDLDAGKLDSYNRLGTTWNDISGNGNNGTLTNFGGQFWNSDNGGNITFDGIDSYVNLSDIPFRITNYSFTSEFVFYFNGNNYTNEPLLGKRSNAAPFNQWSIGINNGNPYVGGTGKVLIAFLRDDNNPNNPSFDRIVTYTLPSAGIYHVVLTNSQSQSQLWVNGILRSNSSVGMASGNFNISGYDFRIGNYYTSNYWDEKFYLTRFYNKTLSNSQITQNYNSIKGRYFSTNLDPDAQNFINIASISNETQINAINVLVVGFKSANLWSKMRVIIPVVGGNSSSHLINLKSPGTFNLNFVGTWTHTNSGMTPTNGYADTGFNPTANLLTSQNIHVSFYSRTDVDNTGSDFGIAGLTHGSITRQGNTLYCDWPSYNSCNLAAPGRLTIANPSSNAMFIFNATPTNVKVFKNNGVLGSGGTINQAIPNQSILLSYGFTSCANRYGNREYAFMTIGEGLTDSEASNLYTVVQQFQTTLNRQV